MPKEPGLTDVFKILASFIILAILLLCQNISTGVDRVMRKLWERV